VHYDQNSIDYEPTNTDDAADFTDLLYEELELRSLDMTGSLEVMRDRLRESFSMRIGCDYYWTK